jgi:3-hydroxyisobutyrate dehydrogenase-like beta-hydroxyacid dehydrogenase
MGAGVGERLTENGCTVLTLLDGRSAASVARAQKAGMRAAKPAEIAAADMILSIVPPGDAPALAEQLAPALRATNGKPVYVDCNAISPDTVARIATVIGATGCAFVDGGIIGGPPRAGQPGPVFYLSGEAADRVPPLATGLRIKLLTGPAGQASALKMSYAGLTKGLTALGAAVALAAGRAGVGEALHAELAESQSALLTRLERNVPDMFPKAYRWVAEMEEIARFVGACAEAKTFQGIAGLYARLAADLDGARQETDALAAFFARPDDGKNR